MGSEYWATFERVADTIYTRTKEECPREHELLTSMFSLYSSAFDALPQTGDGPAPIARVAILSQTLNTFWAMISLAVRGFYIQSLIPLRHTYESWLSFWYLAKFPEDAMRWLNPTRQMRPPKAETMRNRIDHPSKATKSRLGEFQEELHRFAHIDPVALISRLETEGEKTIIGIGVQFDIDSFRACTYGILLWLGNLLDAVSSLVPAEHQWHTAHAEAIEAILQFIEDYNVETGGLQLTKSESEDDAS